MVTSVHQSGDRHSVDTGSFSPESLPFESLRKCNGLTRFGLAKNFLAKKAPSQRTGEESSKTFVLLLRPQGSSRRSSGSPLLLCQAPQWQNEGLLRARWDL